MGSVCGLASCGDGGRPRGLRRLSRREGRSRRSPSASSWRRRWATPGRPPPGGRGRWPSWWRRRRPALRSGSLVLWGGAGLLLGLAAAAVAPRAGDTRAVPVRFVVEVRDGWASGPRGWSTRVRVERCRGSTGAGADCRRADPGGRGRRQGPEALPVPGSRCEGAGELLYSLGPPSALRCCGSRRRLLLRLNPHRGGRWTACGIAVRGRSRRARAAAPGARPGRPSPPPWCWAARRPSTRRRVSALRQSGLAHILSVSGLHVVLVSAILWGILTIAGVPPRARRWLLMPALVAFALSPEARPRCCAPPPRRWRTC